MSRKPKRRWLVSRRRLHDLHNITERCNSDQVKPRRPTVRRPEGRQPCEWCRGTGPA